MGKERDVRAVVVDTNVLISALGWEGNERKAFRKILDGEFQLVISQKQVNELQRVMNYPKFRFTEEQKFRFLAIISEAAVVIDLPDILKIIVEDPDDNIIIETAIAKNAPYIITGDAHLLKLKEHGKTKIVTASIFLHEINAE